MANIQVLRNVTPQQVVNIADELYHQNGYYFIGTLIGSLLYTKYATLDDGLLFHRHTNTPWFNASVFIATNDTIPLVIVATGKAAIHLYNRATYGVYEH